MAPYTQNYTLGRGKVYFARFLDPVLQTIGPWFYIGNTPEFNLTIEIEELPHYSSDEGIREKDDSVPLEVTRTGTMTTDSISPRNVALFFFGTESTVTVAAATGSTETFTDIKVGNGYMYQIGQTAQNPVGIRGIDATTFEALKTATELVAGTDYELDADVGTIHFLAGGPAALADGDDIAITYDVRSSSRPRVISGTTPVEGAMRYVAHNPKGKDFDYMMPYIKVSPNGDYALKGDEWQQIPFTVEALKPRLGEAIYVDGRPVYNP